jgi:hypothetical protein
VQPSREGRSVVAERPAGERARRAITHRLVEMSEHEEEARDAERPEPADAAQRARGLVGIEVTQRLEIAPAGGDLA